jgi:aspartate dehydrogenase
MNILLIGGGAMGRTVLSKLKTERGARISHLLERPKRLVALQAELGSEIEIITSVDHLDAIPDLAIECAGHDAVRDIVPSLLSRGIRTVIASIGALTQDGLPERLERAAIEGKTQLVLVPGAIAGIDALAAASIQGLDSVTYVGTKPPEAWVGTPAEGVVSLRTLSEATVIFDGNAREAARTYPKNANVAAMIALAGIGLERTKVVLVADPAVTRNTHVVRAQGDFGDMEIRVAANPLPGNPKTSALAALSIVRAVRNQFVALAI